MSLSYIFFFALLFSFFPTIKTKEAKIIALVPARNDAHFLPNCLRALALYADAIVYLDDCSTDDSIAIVQSLAQECRVEQIIKKTHWHRSEGGDKNILLQAGRAIGGTHFIVLDADEMFTANCTVDNRLRNHILALKPGERLFLTWIQMWRSPYLYRSDQGKWYDARGDFAFCDDGECYYSSLFLHEKRIPTNLKGFSWVIEGYTYGVMHFQHVNRENLIIKHAWYRCLEHIRNPERPCRELNSQYEETLNETGLLLKPAPREWFFGYPFFDPTAITKNKAWQKDEVKSWFKQYGHDYFADLNIWDIIWE